MSGNQTSKSAREDQSAQTRPGCSEAWRESETTPSGPSDPSGSNDFTADQLDDFTANLLAGFQTPARTPSQTGPPAGAAQQQPMEGQEQQQRTNVLNSLLQVPPDVAFAQSLGAGSSSQLPPPQQQYAPLWQELDTWMEQSYGQLQGQPFQWGQAQQSTYPPPQLRVARAGQQQLQLRAEDSGSGHGDSQQQQASNSEGHKIGRGPGSGKFSSELGSSAGSALSGEAVSAAPAAETRPPQVFPLGLQLADIITLPAMSPGQAEFVGGEMQPMTLGQRNPLLKQSVSHSSSGGSSEGAMAGVVVEVEGDNREELEERAEGSAGGSAGSGGMPSGSDPSDPSGSDPMRADAMYQRKKALNRISQAKYRKKKKDKTAAFERDIHNLREQNSALMRERTSLQANKSESHDRDMKGLQSQNKVLLEERAANQANVVALQQRNDLLESSLRNMQGSGSAEAGTTSGEGRSVSGNDKLDGIDGVLAAAVGRFMSVTYRRPIMISKEDLHTVQPAAVAKLFQDMCNEIRKAILAGAASDHESPAFKRLELCIMAHREMLPVALLSNSPFRKAAIRHSPGEMRDEFGAIPRDRILRVLSAMDLSHDQKVALVAARNTFSERRTTILKRRQKIVEDFIVSKSMYSDDQAGRGVDAYDEMMGGSEAILQNAHEENVELSLLSRYAFSNVISIIQEGTMFVEAHPWRCDASVLCNAIAEQMSLEEAVVPGPSQPQEQFRWREWQP